MKRYRDNNERNPMKGYRDNNMMDRGRVPCAQKAERDIGHVKVLKNGYLV